MKVLVDRLAGIACVRQNHAAILTLDKHFTLMARLFSCDVLT
jgi:hypothetical protein